MSLWVALTNAPLPTLALRAKGCAWPLRASKRRRRRGGFRGLGMGCSLGALLSSVAFGGGLSGWLVALRFLFGVGVYCVLECGVGPESFWGPRDPKWEGEWIPPSFDSKALGLKDGGESFRILSWVLSKPCLRLAYSKGSQKTMGERKL